MLDLTLNSHERVIHLPEPTLVERLQLVHAPVSAFEPLLVLLEGCLQLFLVLVLAIYGPLAHPLDERHYESDDGREGGCQNEQVHGPLAGGKVYSKEWQEHVQVPVCQ